MKTIFRTAIILALLLFALPAFAAQEKGKTNGESGKGDQIPPGTTGSGAITLKQIMEELQYMVAEKYGIVIYYVLPKGWKVEEQGKDPKTGKLREDLNSYVLISHRPMPDPKEPTEFIYELDVYKRGLMEDPPKDLKQGDDPVAVQFANFLNEQLSINLKAGLKCKTNKRDIVPKLYGPKDRPTAFVKITYEVPNGAILHTFTSVTGDKIWQLKFLIAKGQEDNYDPLIPLLLYNTFGMTKEQFDQFVKDQPKGKMGPPPAKKGGK